MLPLVITHPPSPTSNHVSEEQPLQRPALFWGGDVVAFGEEVNVELEPTVISDSKNARNYAVPA